MLQCVVCVCVHVSESVRACICVWCVRVCGDALKELLGVEAVGVEAVGEERSRCLDLRECLDVRCYQVAFSSSTVSSQKTQYIYIHTHTYKEGWEGKRQVGSGDREQLS